MTGMVTRKLDVTQHPDPAGRAESDDPWADFRVVERLEMELQFSFRHSLGKLSPFFLALEDQRLMGTRCPRCGAVWMPPRVHCPEDMAITEWVDLPGTGVLEAASLSAYTLTTGGGQDQLILGYVTLDGADTALLQQIRTGGDPAALTPGTRMRAVWSQVPVAHPMQLFWFEPDV